MSRTERWYFPGIFETWFTRGVFFGNFECHAADENTGRTTGG